VKSLGNGPESGSVQYLPAGTSITVREAATKMISISDNTATDMLVGLLGREAVEAQFRTWSEHADANVPFLTTRQMFLLHYGKGLGEQYLATPRDERAAFLASEVDTRPVSDIATDFTTEPRYVEEIEWFASPDDVCRAFAGLLAQAEQPSSASVLPGVLGIEDGTLDLDPAKWPTVWFKGGSEPGVLTLGWLATGAGGESFVVQAMLTNPDEVLATDAITDLVALGREAFGLLER
jgi:hypothetical protein